MTQAEVLANYTIIKTRFGLYTSVHPDGTQMTTAATREACTFVTENIHIPCLFGTFTGTTTVVGEAFVGGKL